MDISKLIPSKELLTIPAKDLHKFDGSMSGKSLGIIVRSIGQAMCNPERKIIVKLGNDDTPEQIANKLRAFMRKSGIMFVSTIVKNEQTILQYKPWRDEFKNAESWQEMQHD